MVVGGLVEAIEQVNGAQISHDSTFRKRFSDVVADLKQSFIASVAMTISAMWPLWFVSFIERMFPQ